MSIYFSDIAETTKAAFALFSILVHSLWLGAIAAFVAAIIMMLTKKSNPKLRYNLLSGLFLCFLISMLYIFFISIKKVDIYNNAGQFTVPLNLFTEQNTGMLPPENVFQSIVSFVISHAGSFVLIWFAVICFKCSRLIFGLTRLQNLKNKGTEDAGDYWNQKVKELIEKTGLKKAVILLQSSLVKVPVVIGHLKPVILFPVGILNALPANEVEAILLHELAHIRRNDFIINILQQFSEIIFFFNPAVLWLSSLIKNERENCCDDIAIAITADKKNFIHALVSFQEYKAANAYSTAFPGSKNHLLNRVKRIITNNNKTLSNMEKLILTSGIVITCIITAAFYPAHSTNEKTIQQTSSAITQTTVAVKNTEQKLSEKTESANKQVQHIIIHDTVPAGEEIKEESGTIHFDGKIDGKKIKLTEINGQVKELYVDGKKIPGEEYSKYKPVIDMLHKKMKEQTLQLKLQQVELMKQKEILQKEMEIMKQKTEVDYKKQKELMEQNQLQMLKEMEVMKKNAELMKLQGEKMQQDFIKQQKLFMEKQKEFQKKAVELKMQMQELKKLPDSLQIKPVLPLMPVSLTKPALPGTFAAFKPKAPMSPFIKLHSTIPAKPGKPVTPVLNTKPSVELNPGERIID